MKMQIMSNFRVPIGGGYTARKDNSAVMCVSPLIRNFHAELDNPA